jgi:hypothetical protein
MSSNKQRAVRADAAAAGARISITGQNFGNYDYICHFESLAASPLSFLNQVEIEAIPISSSLMTCEVDTYIRTRQMYVNISPSSETSTTNDCQNDF